MHDGLPFGLMILRVELRGDPLFLVASGDQERIAPIVIMEVKNRFVAPAAVRVHSRPGHPLIALILDEYLRIGNRLPVRPAHMTFDGKPVIGLVHRDGNARKGAAGPEHGAREAEGQPPADRSRSSCPSVPQPA